MNLNLSSEKQDKENLKKSRLYDVNGIPILATPEVDVDFGR